MHFKARNSYIITNLGTISTCLDIIILIAIKSFDFQKDIEKKFEAIIYELIIR